MLSRKWNYDHREKTASGVSELVSEMEKQARQDSALFGEKIRRRSFNKGPSGSFEEEGPLFLDEGNVVRFSNNSILSRPSPALVYVNNMNEYVSLESDSMNNVNTSDDLAVISTQICGESVVIDSTNSSNSKSINIESDSSLKEETGLTSSGTTSNLLIITAAGDEISLSDKGDDGQHARRIEMYHNPRCNRVTIKLPSGSRRPSRRSSSAIEQPITNSIEQKEEEEDFNLCVPEEDIKIEDEISLEDHPEEEIPLCDAEF